MPTIAAPDYLVDVPRKLGVGHAKLVGTFLIDRLDRPAGLQVGGDVGELRHEGHAADSFHAPPLGKGAHPRLRCALGERIVTFDLSNVHVRLSMRSNAMFCKRVRFNETERDALRSSANGV